MRINVLCAILTLASLSSPVIAAYHPPVESQRFPGGALVRVNRRTVLMLRRPSGAASPAARASLIEQRLSAAIEAGLTPGAVSVRRSGKQFAIVGGTKELLRPMAADAREARTTARRLAHRWAADL